MGSDGKWLKIIGAHLAAPHRADQYPRWRDMTETTAESKLHCCVALDVIFQVSCFSRTRF